MPEARNKVEAILLPPDFINNSVQYEAPSTLNSTMTGCQNCLLLSQHSGKRLRAFKRPGVVEVATDANFSEIYNFYNWVGYAAAGQLVYFGVGSSVDKMCVSGVTTYSHADSTKINYVTEMLNSSGTSCLVWTRASDAWIYPKAGAVAQISAVPATMSGGLINIDGWTFVACNTTNGARIYNSNLNDPTTGYTDYVAVNIHPDTLVTVYKYKNFCLAFGTDSLEWYQVSDNEFGSPLKRVPQYFSRVGLIPNATDVGVPAICEGNETIYWIGRGAHVGIPQVYTLEGTNPVKISTPDIEQMLQYNNSIGNLSIKYVSVKGCRMVLVRTADGTALVYHVDLKMWSAWYGNAVAWSSALNFSSSSSLVYVAKADTGIYGKIDQTTIAGTGDFGSTVLQKIVFERTSFGTYAKKTARKLRVLGTEGYSGTFTIGLDIFYDKNTSASINRTLTSTNLGLIEASNLGTFREATVVLSNSVTVPMAIDGVELEYEVLDD